MKPSDLYTLNTSTEGVQMPVKFPNGTLTGQFLTVIGTDSEDFDIANAIHRKERTSILALPEGAHTKAFNEAQTRLVAACVTGWSFDAKFSREAVIELLTQSPDIRKQVDDFAVDRRNFFKMPPTN